MPPPSAPESWGFIVSFGGESFSSAVLPSGSGGLVVGEPQHVVLRFLVRDVEPYLTPGAQFTFFEQYRTGAGRIIERRNA
jgi:hypothetical protein